MLPAVSLVNTCWDQVVMGLLLEKMALLAAWKFTEECFSLALLAEWKYDQRVLLTGALGCRKV